MEMKDIVKPLMTAFSTEDIGTLRYEGCQISCGKDNDVRSITFNFDDIGNVKFGKVIDQVIELKKILSDYSEEVYTLTNDSIYKDSLCVTIYVREDGELNCTIYISPYSFR